MHYTTDIALFRQEQEQRLPKYYSANKSKLKGFGGVQEFIKWYLNELDNNRHTCHYCNTDILEIRQLINDGVISGRAVSNSGLRGPNLEIDRKDPFALYDHQNCVLSCYYCNNDKSNTFSYDIYKKIFGSLRRESWVELINKAFK
jgi:hypothetical protein